LSFMKVPYCSFVGFWATSEVSSLAIVPPYHNILTVVYHLGQEALQ
jgi:hypothetical protein